MKLQQETAELLLGYYKRDLGILMTEVVAKGKDKDIKCLQGIVEALEVISKDGESQKDPNITLKESVLDGDRLKNIIRNYYGYKEETPVFERLMTLEGTIKRKLQTAEVKNQLEENMEYIADNSSSPKNAASIVTQNVRKSGLNDPKMLEKVEEKAKQYFVEYLGHEEKGFKDKFKEFVQLIKSFGMEIYNNFVDTINKYVFNSKQEQSKSDPTHHRDKLKEQQNNPNETGQGNNLY